MITVYFDGQVLEMTLEDLIKANHNMVVNKTNGYSHDWSEVVAFDLKYVRNNTARCTKRPIGGIHGSDVVSFS